MAMAKWYANLVDAKGGKGKGGGGGAGLTICALLHRWVLACTALCGEYWSPTSWRLD